LHDKVAGGAAVVRNHQELLSSWTEPFSANSKTDPTLAKAELISDAGGALVITYLRKGKKCCAPVVRERNEKNVREPALQTPRSVKKEREEVLQALEHRFPCSLW